MSAMARALANRSPVLINSLRRVAGTSQLDSSVHSCRSFHSSLSSGFMYGDKLVEQNYWDNAKLHLPSWFVMQRRLFSSGSGSVDGAPTEPVKDLYDKILKSMAEQKSAPSNTWLRSLIQQTANREDVKLLFDILQRLRIFRMAKLGIPDSFNCALCEDVAKACLRVGAIDYGKKAIFKHNVYGLSPNMGSAHRLLLYAEQQKDVKLMIDIMKLLKKNNLPLQAGTADIVFRICYETENWGYLSKYAKRFLKAGGVNLRQSSVDLWMDFSAKIGDVESLWKVEKLRSETQKQHTLLSGFACAKGFLLEKIPENAAAIIEQVNQTLPDGKRQGIVSQLQKLLSEWPLQVIKHQKEENRMAVAAALQKDIPAMIAGLSSMGSEVNVDIDDLITKAGVLS